MSGHQPNRKMPRQPSARMATECSTPLYHNDRARTERSTCSDQHARLSSHAACPISAVCSYTKKPVDSILGRGAMVGQNARSEQSGIPQSRSKRHGNTMHPLARKAGPRRPKREYEIRHGVDSFQTSIQQIPSSEITSSIISTAHHQHRRCAWRPVRNCRSAQMPRRRNSEPDHNHAHRDHRRADAGRRDLSIDPPRAQTTGLETGAHVTVWRYHPEQLAIAKYTGRITQVGDDTATFAILRAEVDERWPAEINPLGAGAPVYLALRGSFEPDISRTATTVALEAPEDGQE